MPAPGTMVVFVDANVWYSRTLRDWVGRLYTLPETPPFEVRWTEDVMAEVLYSLRRKHPNWDGGRITRIRDLLQSTFEVGRVESFPMDERYQGKDPLDAHVHAAAVACGAGILLTCNVSDFVWDEDTAPYDVLHPDAFLTLLDDSAPELIRAATLSMNQYWFSKTGSANLPARLKKAGCPEFAERVRRHTQGQEHALLKTTD